VKEEKTTMKPNLFENQQARKALQLAVAAALPLALAACGAAEPTDTGSTGGTSGSVSTAPTASCVPLNQQIPFTLTNAQITARKLYAGAIPGSQAVGTVFVGGAVAAGGVFQGTGLDNSILSMNITQAGGATTTTGSYGYNPYDWMAYQSYANATGYLQVGTTLQQQAALLVQLGYINIPGLSTGAVGTTTSWTTPSTTAPTQTVAISPSQLCVSSIAMTINIHPYYNTLYIGDVYLYLNNTQHGFSVEF